MQLVSYLEKPGQDELVDVDTSGVAIVENQRKT